MAADDELHAAYTAAAAAWPGVSCPQQAFQRYVRERLGDDSTLTSLHAADLFLACACGRGDQAALAAFDHLLEGATALFLRHVDCSAAMADDVRQILRTRLILGDDGVAPRLGQYAGRGSLASWLGVGAQRTALSLLRRDRAHSRAADAAAGASLTSVVDPEIDYLKSRYRVDFRAAFADAIGALSARDRVLLRLHLIDRLSHERIGVMYNVNQSTVTRWIAAAREVIVRETHTSLRRRCQLETAELDSLAALVASQIDLSLSRLLGEPAPS